MRKSETAYPGIMKIMGKQFARRKPRILTFIAMICFAATTGFAQAPITLTIDTTSHGYAIPPDFSGLSFESGSERPNNARVSGYLFSPTNSQVVTLFQNLSLKSLRVGGGSVDNTVPAGLGSDGYTGIDNLFGFAKATGAKVIYSVRLLNGNATSDAAIAQYVWRNYRAYVSSFSIGNEPDWKSYHKTDPRITDYPSYLADWRNFASAIFGAAPGATFSGPDTGDYTGSTYYNGESWTQLFADDEKNSGLIADINQHFYVGGGPGSTTAQQAIDNMLSTAWVDNADIGTQLAGASGTTTYVPYSWLLNHNLAPVIADGLPYRLTESNDYLGGVAGASNGYAAALWTLDYMHWWALHGAAGVNFHNKQWILTDTIVPSPNPCNTICGNYQTTPKGYGIKAFDLSGHGYVEPITISNPAGANLTAYAVGDARDLYISIINKTHSSTADSTDASVTIMPNGFTSASAAYMVLTDGDSGNASLLEATLGGAPITNNSRWLGQWTPLNPDTTGSVTLTVQAATAVVVKIHAASAYTGPVQINQDGALEVFGTGSNGDTWHMRQGEADVPNSPLSNWSGWTDLQGGISSTGGTAVVKNQDNTLEIFVPGTTGHVYHNWQLGPGGPWNGWADLGGSGTTDLVSASNADGSVSLFGIGTNGDVWTNSESAPGVGWSGWTDLSGVGIKPGYAVGQNLNGHLEVLGVDSRGEVWHNSQTSSGTWSGWNQLAGQQVNARLAIFENLDGRLEVFGVNGSGDVWHNWQTSPGGSWTGWSEIRGIKLQPGFVVGQDKDGQPVVLGVRARSNRGLGGLGVWSIRRLSSGDWDSWNYLGGPEMDPQLVVSSTADGRLQLFGIGGNHDVWSNWETANGDWNGWSDFGGNGTRFYAGQR